MQELTSPVAITSSDSWNRNSMVGCSVRTPIERQKGATTSERGACGLKHSSPGLGVPHKLYERSKCDAERGNQGDSSCSGRERHHFVQIRHQEGSHEQRLIDGRLSCFGSPQSFDDVPRHHRDHEHENDSKHHALPPVGRTLYSAAYR